MIEKYKEGRNRRTQIFKKRRVFSGLKDSLSQAMLLYLKIFI
jgi:hypothetical protein